MDMEISKYCPSCKRRTLVGLISTTFIPSMDDPSVAIMPLIMANRLEGSSNQAMADNFNDAGFVADTLAVGSTGFFGEVSNSFGTTFWISFLSTMGVVELFVSTGVLRSESFFSAGLSTFGGTRLISSCALRTDACGTGAGVCLIAAGGGFADGGGKTLDGTSDCGEAGAGATC